MESETFISVAEMQAWLRDQRAERIPNGGIRRISREIGLHENALYRILKGAMPSYKTAAKLREYISNAR
jgi:hypothetical protein